MKVSQFVSILALVPLVACESGDRANIRDVPVTTTYKSTALHKEAHIIRTEGDVPHIYAATRHDAAYVLGFTMARDRFFMMDLARRLGTGKVSELLGDAGLASDQQSRMAGMTYVTDQIASKLTDALADHVDAFAAGVNDYIEQVRAGNLPPPTEFDISYAFIGGASAVDLMKPFERRDVCAIVSVTIYNSSFETGDVNRAAITAKLPTFFNGVADEALRKAGLQRDIWSSIIPLFQDSSAPGLGTTYGQPFISAPATSTSSALRQASSPPVSGAMLARLTSAFDAMQVRMNRDRVSGYGSNAWAVAGSSTADGHAVMAGDGHLSLAVPPILYQFGIDTTVFGDGDLHQLGLSIPGFPLMAIGTNGKVAWSQTQLGEDITDWYREIIQLDANGEPVASKWGDAWMPLQHVDETYNVAAIPALGSVGGTQTWRRYMTFDGRWLADFEGALVMKPTDPVPAGKTLLKTQSGYVLPGDEDADGVVTGVSFSYAGFFAGEILSATDALGHAGDVEAFRQGTKGLVGYSQNFAVADANGNILYSSYEPIPCRANLPRNADGSFVEGADPTLLLDGTKYGAWRIPVKDGKVDETASATDPQACVVPFDKVPQSVNPTAGFVATANNDPGGLSFDNSVFNDEVYVGGPWDEGFRVDTIGRNLKKQIADKTAGVDGMAKIQANIDSRLGELLAPYFVQAIDNAKTASATGTPESMRLAAIYATDSAAFDEVGMRLKAWRDRGYQAHGGVQTFYRSPSATDVEDSIATMIFNVWMRQVKSHIFDDEEMGEALNIADGEAQMRILSQLFRGRGDAGKDLLASWEPTRKESVFFDDLNTPSIIETSDEVTMAGLVDALAFLRSKPTAKGKGGFGTSDMTQWIWGLRHQVRFESLIASYISDPALSIITNQLEINTDVVPLVGPDESLASDDPRADLHWFPRDGDQYGVDAANPGLGGTDFTHGSGPVMRMVFELTPQGVRGQNIIPGGQSGLTTSKHFSDQVRLWLANKAYPARFDVASVLDGQTGHEVFTPN